MKITLTSIAGGKSLQIDPYPTCSGMYVVVDLDRLDTDNERNAWRIVNADLFDRNQAGPAINVDPTELLNEEMRTPGFYLAWLQTNQYLIDFPRSSNFLKCGHTLPDDDIDILDALPDLADLSLNQFKALINRPVNYFDNVKYERHVRLYVNSGKLDAEIIRFRPGSNCFSFPLLRAIVGDATDARFIFKQFVEREGDPPIIIFIVIIGTQRFGYYNFTKIPPLIGC